MITWLPLKGRAVISMELDLWAQKEESSELGSHCFRWGWLPSTYQVRWGVLLAPLLSSGVSRMGGQLQMSPAPHGAPRRLLYYSQLRPLSPADPQRSQCVEDICITPMTGWSKKVVCLSSTVDIPLLVNIRVVEWCLDAHAVTWSWQVCQVRGTLS